MSPWLFRLWYCDIPARRRPSPSATAPACTLNKRFLLIQCVIPWVRQPVCKSESLFHYQHICSPLWRGRGYLQGSGSGDQTELPAVVDGLFSPTYPILFKPRCCSSSPKVTDSYLRAASVLCLLPAAWSFHGASQMRPWAKKRKASQLWDVIYNNENKISY